MHALALDVLWPSHLKCNGFLFYSLVQWDDVGPQQTQQEKDKKKEQKTTELLDALQEDPIIQEGPRTDQQHRPLQQRQMPSMLSHVAFISLVDNVEQSDLCCVIFGCVPFLPTQCVCVSVCL